MTLSENFNLNAIVLNRFYLTEYGGRVFTNLIGCQDKEQRPIPYDTKFAEKSMTKDINFLQTQDWQSLLWFSQCIRIKTLQGPIGPGGAKDRPQTAPTTAVLAPLAAKKNFSFTQLHHKESIQNLPMI